MTAIFPSLPGLSWSTFKAPEFKTRVQTSVSKRELRLVFAPLPVWNFTLKFEFLRDKNDTRQSNWGTNLDELRTLMGFFLSQQGSFQTFLYDDPTDDNVVNGSIMNTVTSGFNGDGSTTTFQLVRIMNGFAEPIIAPNTVGSVFINGVLQSPTDYSINAGTGIITFTTAPGNGLPVTASFNYYFLVRFKDDTNNFENFLYQLWSVNELKLISVLL